MSDSRHIDVFAETARLKAQRKVRVERTAIARTADAYAMLAHSWLAAHDDLLRRRAGVDRMAAGVDGDALARASDAARVLAALEIVSREHLLVLVKSVHALCGSDARSRGETIDDRRVQNDANGSATLSLLCIDRSELAWRALAQWADNEVAAVLADLLVQLRVEVDAEFPDARRFVRPGSDEEPGISDR